MTKKIFEFHLDDKVIFEFQNLNTYEGLFLVSYLIEHEIDAIVMDSFLCLFYNFRSFKKDDLEFKLVSDDNHGIYLTLVKHDVNKISALRNLANQLLNLIRTKSNRYVTKKGQRLIRSSWKEQLDKLYEED